MKDYHRKFSEHPSSHIDTKKLRNRKKCVCVCFWWQLLGYILLTTILHNVCAKSLQLCPTLRPHGLQPTRLLCPRDFPGKNYWSGLLCPPPGDLPDLRIEPMSFMSNLHWQVSSSPLVPPGKPRFTLYTLINFCPDGLPGLMHA